MRHHLRVLRAPLVWCWVVGIVAIIASGLAPDDSMRRGFAAGIAVGAILNLVVLLVVLGRRKP